MNQRISRLYRCVTAALVGAAMFPVASAAAVNVVQPIGVRSETLPVRARMTTMPAATTWHTVRTGSHVFYGTIMAMNGGTIRLRLRSGNMLNFDGTAAIAGGNYSMPLFVGKLVTVDGEASNGKLVASHILRLPNLNNLPADR